MFQWIGMVEYIPCYSAPVEHWGFIPATRLASRIILIEQNIKKRTGPALCTLWVQPKDIRRHFKERQHVVFIESYPLKLMLGGMGHLLFPASGQILPRMWYSEDDMSPFLLWPLNTLCLRHSPQFFPAYSQRILRNNRRSIQYVFFTE
jgi:hypothetical protein